MTQKPSLIAADLPCHQLPNPCRMFYLGRVRMMGRVTSLVFTVLLSLCSNVPCTHADNVYVSTANLNTILETQFKRKPVHVRHRRLGAGLPHRPRTG